MPAEPGTAAVAASCVPPTAVNSGAGDHGYRRRTRPGTASIACGDAIDISMTFGMHLNRGRLDRALRITAGVLGVIVAVPSFLAFLFVVLFVWLGSDDTPLWLAVPLGMLAIVQLYLAIRTLSAGWRQR